MEYREFETNSDGLLEKCIRCKNHKLVGDFCHICGAPVKNFCSNFYNEMGNYNTCNHSEPLLGNARFCPDCGSKSTFYQSNILDDWNIEYNNYSKNEELKSKFSDNKAENYDSFINISDGIDEELPFN